MTADGARRPECGVQHIYYARPHTARRASGPLTNNTDSHALARVAWSDAMFIRVRPPCTPDHVPSPHSTMELSTSERPFVRTPRLPDKTRRRWDSLQDDDWPRCRVCLLRPWVTMTGCVYPLASSQSLTSCFSPPPTGNVISCRDRPWVGGWPSFSDQPTASTSTARALHDAPLHGASTSTLGWPTLSLARTQLEGSGYLLKTAGFKLLPHVCEVSLKQNADDTFGCRQYHLQRSSGKGTERWVGRMLPRIVEPCHLKYISPLGWFWPPVGIC